MKRVVSLFIFFFLVHNAVGQNGNKVKDSVSTVTHFVDTTSFEDIEVHVELVGPAGQRVKSQKKNEAFREATYNQHIPFNGFGENIKQAFKTEIPEEFIGSPALYLYHRTDYQLYKDYNGTIKIKHHYRIKILTNAGKEQADVKLRNYTKGNYHKLKNIKASTFNMKDGVLVEEKVNESDIFIVEDAKKLSSYSFSFPKVEVGSIVEYSYDEELRKFRFPKQTINTDIPALDLQITLNIPEGYNAEAQIRGFLTPDSLFVKYKQTDSDKRFRHPARTHWVRFKNVSVVEDLPFLIGESDQETTFDINTQTSILNTQLFLQSRQILENPMYRGLINKKSAVVKEIASSIDKSLPQKEQAIAATAQVKNYCTWNEEYGLLGSQTHAAFTKDFIGNIADINFLLISVLRQLDIKAHPTFVAKRSDGQVNINDENFAGLSHPVVMVLLEDDEKLILNASVKDVPSGFPGFEDIVEEGIRLADKRMSFEAVNKHIPTSRQFIRVEASIEPDGTLAGNYIENSNGYFAALAREIIKEGDEKVFDFKTELEESDYLVEDIETKNLEDVNKKFEYQSTFSIFDFAYGSGDELYFNPVIFNRVTYNPFKDEERNLRIDFPFPLDEVQSYNIKIPAGYTIQELPKGSSISLPDKSATATLAFNQIDDVLQINHRFIVKRSSYKAEAYGVIKEFYEQTVDLHNAQIVLKKINE